MPRSSRFLPFASPDVRQSEPLPTPIRLPIMSSRPIDTIGELLRELLRHRDLGAYPGILSLYQVPSRDLEPYFRWNPRHYTRTCIHRNDDFELLVICYEPGQRTSIHDFNSETAWVHPVIGEVVEERFLPGPDGKLTQSQELLLRPGQLDRFSSGSDIHRFSNRGPDRAVTLNLYARPMSQWRVFDERTGGVSVAPVGPPR